MSDLTRVQTMGTRCPHGKDKSHGGLGKALCDAGIEGAKYLRDREARIAAYKGAPARLPSSELPPSAPDGER